MARSLSSSAVLLATLLLISVVHILLCFAMQDVQYSIWFSFARYEARLFSEFQSELAAAKLAVSEQLRRQRHQPSARVRARNESLCAAIVTTPREFPFVTVLVGSLLRGTPDRDDLRVIIVTADRAHAEAEELAQLDGFELQRCTLDSDLAALDSDSLPLHLKSWIKKQTQVVNCAMAACGAHARRAGAPFFVMLEDDGILADAFVARVRHGLAALSQHQDWFYVKLFTSDFFSGWDVDDVPLIAAPPVAIWCIALLLIRRNPSKAARTFVLAAGASIACLVVAGAGKQNLFRWRTGLTPIQQHFSMCANVFNTDATERFLAFAGEKMRANDGDLNSDILLNRFLGQPENANLSAYNLVPNLYQHVGFSSSCASQSCRNEGKARGVDAARMKQSSTFVRHSDVKVKR
jgi:hypothetical protein